MLSLGKLGAHSLDYYLGRVADSIEDYYLGHGEAPGRWGGRGRREFGLDGEVGRADLEAVLKGDDPRTLEHLATARRRVRGWDFCFRAPKSVSLLYGLGEPEVAATVVAIHEEAAGKAFDWMEREALRSRRGRNGVETVHTTGFCGAMFRHRVSREGDPHLHTHVLTPNLVRGTDGRWATPHSNLFHHLARTGGYLYEAHCRARAVELLGLEWGEVVNGIADVAGFEERWLKAFSKRKAQIEADLTLTGFSSRRAREVASLKTRKAKGHGMDAHRLRAGWWEEAADVGLTPEALAATLDRVEGRTLRSAADLEALAVHLSGPSGLTEKVSAFTRHDVLRAVAGAFSEGATVAEVEAWADAYLARPELRQLPGHSRKHCAPFHSTADMLALERRALKTVAHLRGVGYGLAPVAAVSKAVGDRPSLSGEQVEMVERLTRSGHGVEAVVAGPGTGKTFTLDACREAWQRAGLAVLGCALAGKAADRLADDTGIPSSTIASLLLDLGSEHSGGLPAGGVLVVDEAGMVGTRTVARLMEYAQAAGAKIVLVGDPDQLPEIEAGGMIRGIESRFDVVRLAENRRQREAWERAALDDLKSGRALDAFVAYDDNGAVVRGSNAIALREVMVGDWWWARGGGEEAVMLAARRHDVDDLNARARVRMRETGHLSGPELVLDERPYQAGDEIVCLRNNRRLGVFNGTRAEVTQVDPGARTLTIRTAKHRTVTLPRWYLEKGHVAHGYAVTVHKAQGLTTERAFVLGTDDLYRELAYTALSRGTAANLLYVVGAPERDDDHHLAPEPPEPEELVVAAMENSRAKSLALDELWDAPAKRLRALHAERARLAPVVAGASPDPRVERRGLVEAREQARQALRAAEREVDQTRARPGMRRPKPRQAWALARREEALQRARELEQRNDALVLLGIERDEYVAAHRDDLVRAEHVEKAIDCALEERVAEVETFRPEYLVAVIGNPPRDEQAQERWRKAAARIEDQRAALGVDDEGSVLGPEPVDPGQLAEWRLAHQDVEMAKVLATKVPRMLRHLEQLECEPDLGIGMEL